MRPLAIVVATALFSLLLSSGPVVAQDDEPPVQIEEVQDDSGGIIRKPNSGRAPESATDRGGALQLALLGLIILFPVVAVFSIRHQSRRSRPSSTT